MTYPKYIQELGQITYDMWNKGWDEYNGGNVSYRLTEDEIASLQHELEGTPYTYYTTNRKEVEVLDVPEHIRGEYLLITASGSHFRVLHSQPQIDTGVIKLTAKGSLTLDLWAVLTESIVVFPDGIAVLPWEVPGTQLIGDATAEALKTHRLVVWSKHGVLSTGKDFQDCFGLIETAEKAAHMALELQRISGKSIYDNNIISHEDLQKVCDILGVKGKYLNE